jgi:PRC-barrel domain
MLIRKLALISAVSAFALGTALAQQTTPPAGSAPSATQEAPKATDTMPKASDTGMKADTAAKPQFIAAQKPDQWLASKFKGTDVLGPDDQKVGDVSDILFDKSGKIDAYVIGVGGFLGIGQKDVALAPTAFQVVPGDPNSATSSSPKMKISMTKDELKQAPNFEPYKEPSRATTGTGGGAPRPAPGGMNR